MNILLSIYRIFFYTERPALAIDKGVGRYFVSITCFATIPYQSAADSLSPRWAGFIFLSAPVDLLPLTPLRHTILDIKPVKTTR
jgi:hypothetical protein